MDSVIQHGSSSGYIHDGPDFLIAQQHLQAVADMLASTTFQTMDADPRADATASLSAIRAILSPESREIRAELAEVAKPDGKMHISARVGSVGGTGIAGIDQYNLCIIAFNVYNLSLSNNMDSVTQQGPIHTDT